MLSFLEINLAKAQFNVLRKSLSGVSSHHIVNDDQRGQVFLLHTEHGGVNWVCSDISVPVRDDKQCRAEELKQLVQSIICGLTRSCQLF